MMEVSERVLGNSTGSGLSSGEDGGRSRIDGREESEVIVGVGGVGGVEGAVGL